MTKHSNRSIRLQALAAATALALAAPLAMAQQTTKVADPLGGLDAATQSLGGFDRFIVKFRENSPEERNQLALQRALDKAASTANHLIQARRTQGGKAPFKKPLAAAHVRENATGGDVIRVSNKLDNDSARILMRQLAANPNVESVEVDALLQPVFTPNDPLLGAQGHYNNPTWGIRADLAWDLTNGSGQVVAVLDTGITNHPDLNANILPGYDFIGDTFVSVDGNGRDADPSDPGDWRAADVCGPGTPARDSSWHGTHVAGTVAAVTNNAVGVAGVAWGAKVVPLRVLGRCGGYTSDIADAIVWASGGAVPGVPANPYPAKVINMSLGGSGTCSPVSQAAINIAVSRGTTVVAAAGNSNSDVGAFNPASCANTISVAATNNTANRASFSNFGPRIDIAAPGTPIASTLNAGLTVPAAPNYVYYQGTSMSAPHVAAVAAMINAWSPTPRTPAQVEHLIKASVRDVPALQALTTAYVGRGILDARAALDQVKPCGVYTGNALTVCRALCESNAEPGLRNLFSQMWENGMPNTPPPCDRGPRGKFTNASIVPIPDGLGAFVAGPNAESAITVSGVGGYAGRGTAVTVDITHTWVSDLRLDLVAPDGTVYNLVNRAGGSSDNIPQTFVVNASAELANGTWKLRANDNFNIDTGTIRSWSIQL